MADYYATLGVGRDADDSTIRKAFREQARRLHPDVNRHDPEAEEKFKALNEAYEVLSDPKKRALYDRYGTVRVQDLGGFGGEPGFGFESVSDIFEMFFGEGGVHRATDLSGRDVAVELELDLEEAAFGTTKDVSVERAVACAACDASGAADGSAPEACPECHGRGAVRTAGRTLLGTIMREATCTRCGGLGQVIKEPCKQCGGQGRALKGESLSVDVPAGVDDGTTLRVPQAGEAGVRGGRPGDLYVQVRVRRHPVFERHGDDLYAVLPLGFSQAALGGQVKVAGLDGEVSISIPAGTQPGDQFVVRGAGVPRLRGRGRGDLIVQATVQVPDKLTREERKLLEELERLEGRRHVAKLISPRGSASNRAAR